MNTVIFELKTDRVYTVTDMMKVSTRHHGQRILIQIDSKYYVCLSSSVSNFLINNEDFLKSMTISARNYRIGLKRLRGHIIQFHQLPKLYSIFMTHEAFKNFRLKYLTKK